MPVPVDGRRAAVRPVVEGEHRSPAVGHGHLGDRHLRRPAAVRAEEKERAALDDDDAAAVDALPRGSALLVVQRGPGAGNRFLLDQDVVTAGRHPESEIFLDDITVSRRHVEFRRTADGFTVSDVGSLNGTYVNRDRIDEAVLANGDEVQIGKFRLVYFAGDVPGDL